MKDLIYYYKPCFITRFFFIRKYLKYYKIKNNIFKTPHIFVNYEKNYAFGMCDKIFNFINNDWYVKIKRRYY